MRVKRAVLALAVLVVMLPCLAGCGRRSGPTNAEALGRGRAEQDKLPDEKQVAELLGKPEKICQVIKADLDSNGRPEYVVLYRPQSNETTVIPQDAIAIIASSDGKLRKVWSEEFETPASMQVGDFNNDGKEEIFVRQSLPGGTMQMAQLLIYTYENNECHEIYSTGLIEEFMSGELIDVDEDGIDEVVVSFIKEAFCPFYGHAGRHDVQMVVHEWSGEDPSGEPDYLKLEPDGDTEVLNNKAVDCCVRKEWDRAFELYARALKLSPDNKLIRRNKEVAELYIEAYDSDIEWYKQEAPKRLGYAYFEKGDYERALPLLLKRGEGKADFYAALIYHRQGMFDKAIACLEFEDADYDDYKGLLALELAFLYAEKGAWEKARRLYRKGRTIADFSINITYEDYIRFGRLWESKNLATAKRIYLDALEQFEAFEDEAVYPEAHYYLAKIYEAQGNTAKAVEHYTKALSCWRRGIMLYDIPKEQVQAHVEELERLGDRDQ